MENLIDIQRTYLNVVQHKVLLQDTTNLIGEFGRGDGKTSFMFSPRIIRVAHDMPRATMLLIAPTYTFLQDTIVPGIITYLNQNYVRGVHFEYGKEPPAHFWKPYTPVGRWKHTISFVWGSVLLWGSLDRPESIVGKNVVHIFLDELLRVDETAFIERAIPTLRENKALWGKSHYFGGITGFSSTPNNENDNDWWLQWEKNVNRQAIKELEYVSFRVSQANAMLVDAQTKFEEALAEGKASSMDRMQRHINRLSRFISNWGDDLLIRRKSDECAWSYLKGSSFSNLAILGLDYMKRQLSGSRSNFDKFKLSILGIRPERVKEMFFANFGKQHIFTDSYRYNTDKNNEVIEAAGERHRDSSDLKYCDPDRPLIMGFDPGNFMSAVFLQERSNEARIIKDFCVWTPKQHFDLAVDIDEFFKPHRRKYISLYPDRAGHKRSPIYANNPKGKTDVAILKRCLEDLGWRVEVCIPSDQRTIYYWEHYMLLDVLLNERDKRAPRLRFCQFECERLISSIYMSPIKREKGSGIELDKSSEVKLDPEDQQWYSTQLPSALMYAIFGLYEKYKPQKMAESFDIIGL